MSEKMINPFGLEVIKSLCRLKELEKIKEKQPWLGEKGRMKCVQAEKGSPAKANWALEI